MDWAIKEKAAGGVTVGQHSRQTAVSAACSIGVGGTGEGSHTHLKLSVMRGMAQRERCAA